MARVPLKSFAMFNPFNDTMQIHLLTSFASPSPLSPLKEVIYIYLQMTSIQNKVFVYSFVDKFTKNLQNKLGPWKVLEILINKYDFFTQIKNEYVIIYVSHVYVYICSILSIFIFFPFQEFFFWLSNTFPTKSIISFKNLKKNCGLVILNNKRYMWILQHVGVCAPWVCDFRNSHGCDLCKCSFSPSSLCMRSHLFLSFQISSFGLCRPNKKLSWKVKVKSYI
jgi:hypothetical protein